MEKKVLKRFSGMLAAVLVIVSAAGPSVQARPKAKDSAAGRVVSVIRKYSDCDGVDAIRIGPFLLNIARMSEGDSENASFLKYAGRISLFSADSASSGLQADIRNDMSRALENYEKAVDIHDGNDAMAIYLCMDGDTVREMVLYSEPEADVIVVEGKFPVSEIEKIASDVTRTY